MFDKFNQLADLCDEKITNFFKSLVHFFLSDVGKVLWDSLGTPDNWEYGGYTIVHKKSNITLWVANGSWFLDGYDSYVYTSPIPPILEIGLLERHILWFRVRPLMKRRKNNPNDMALDMLRSRDD